MPQELRVPLDYDVVVAMAGNHTIWAFDDHERSMRRIAGQASHHRDTGVCTRRAAYRTGGNSPSTPEPILAHRGRPGRELGPGRPGAERVGR